MAKITYEPVVELAWIKVKHSCERLANGQEVLSEKDERFFSYKTQAMIIDQMVQMNRTLAELTQAVNVLQEKFDKDL